MSKNIIKDGDEVHVYLKSRTGSEIKFFYHEDIGVNFSSVKDICKSMMDYYRYWNYYNNSHDPLGSINVEITNYTQKWESIYDLYGRKKYNKEFPYWMK